jgi:RNA polymerase sigma factor (TIGR02999 family)
MASRRLASEQANAAALQTTELIHEAWLRLFPTGESAWQNRAHFFGAAAEAMRRVLVDAARQRRALRRGGDRKRFDLLDDDQASREANLDLVLDIDAALKDLQAIDPRVAEVVKLRYFAGLTNQETAEVLGIGEATSQRYWAYARAWLFDRISVGQNPETGTTA